MTDDEEDAAALAEYEAATTDAEREAIERRLITQTDNGSRPEDLPVDNTAADIQKADPDAVAAAEAAVGGPIIPEQP